MRPRPRTVPERRRQNVRWALRLAGHREWRDPRGDGFVIEGGGSGPPLLVTYAGPSTAGPIVAGYVRTLHRFGYTATVDPEFHTGAIVQVTRPSWTG